MSKLDSSGEYDALILAAAGLERIGASERVSELLPVESMCPAAGAGIIVIEHREGNSEMAELLRPLTDPDACWTLSAERAVLAGLQGNCQSAVAASARIVHGEVVLRATVWGAGKVLEANGAAPFSYAEQLGGEIAGELLAQGAAQLLEAGVAVLNPERA